MWGDMLRQYMLGDTSCALSSVPLQDWLAQNFQPDAMHDVAECLLHCLDCWVMDGGSSIYRSVLRQHTTPPGGAVHRTTRFHTVL